MAICSRLLIAAFAVALLASPAVAEGKKYALLVGVKEYEHASLGDLKFSENDAEELSKLLVGPQAGFEVVVLTTTRGKTDEKSKPTAKNIREQLKRLSGKVTKHDVLLVGLAGHGLQIAVTEADSDKERNESFFCPTDAKPRAKGTLEELKETMIPMLELFKDLDESGAGVRLLLVDACRNELKAGSRNFDVDILPKPGKGTAVLFSCKGGEKAFESDKLGIGHGIFFYNVIEGLKGKAKTEKGEITWTRLAEYVTEKVADEAPALIGGAKQTPHEIKNFEGKPPVLVTVPLEELPKPKALDPKDKDDEKVLQEEKDKEENRLAEERRKAKEKGLEDDVAAAEKAQTEKEAREQKEREDKEAAEKAQAEKEAREQKEREDKEAADKAQAEKVAREQKEREDKEAADKAQAEKVAREQKEREDKAKREQEQKDEGFVQGLDAFFGLKGPRDLDRAAKLFREAADRNHAPARGLLGWMTFRGIGIAADREAGEKLLQAALPGVKEAAERGDVGSLYLLASMHQHGVVVEKDRDTASKLARTAADKNFAPAMRLLAGLAFADEKHEEMAEWSRKAAELGDVPSMFNLADCYGRGRGIERDNEKAFNWYRKAAKQGHVEALYQVAFCIETGSGVEADVCTALKLYAHAASKGSVSAMRRLGVLYENGKGVRVNYAEARKWYTRAAAKGDERSMYALGQIYENGLGVCKDCAVAKKWYVQSAQCGYKPALKKVSLTVRD